MPVSEYSQDTDRTADVLTHDQTPFSKIILDNPKILKGLTDCGFINASPIQVAALPTIICGNDTIVEAKNGTGKTLTFVVPTLLRLKIEQKHLQTIILAPTREIAVQIQQCIKKVGQHLSELKCEYFIGGTSVEDDKEKAKNCQIAVGSPGRIKHLLSEHVLNGSEVKSFILDEVDRLFTDKNFTKDIRLIDAKLPKLKQMIVVSASIDKNNMSLFDEFMKGYSVVNGAEEDMNASQDPSKFLLGIKQYVACVKAVSTNIILLPAKNLRLLNILRNLPYTQCIIFTNYMTRVEAVCNMLRDHKYKADYIRGDQDQNIRLKLVDRLTSFKSQILVATDLIARGIDSSNVDLVINMDCPNDWATYLHRIGRAGRFGNKGYSFTILDDDKELKHFKRIINSIENVTIKMLPIAIEKPILDYGDNELENLNLMIQSDIVSNHQNENTVAKENGEKINGQANFKLKSSNTESIISNLSDDPKLESEIKSVHETISSEKTNEQSNSEFTSCNSEFTVNNTSIEFKLDEEIKSVFRPGVSEEESLLKLCKVVKETEKKLIDDNLINKKHLTTDRSFVLFDPEPYLDDSKDYLKYSPEELIDIVSNFGSDIVRYEAAKKSEKCVAQKTYKNSNEACLEYNASNQLSSTEYLKSDRIINLESQNQNYFEDTFSNIKADLENKCSNLSCSTDKVKNDTDEISENQSLSKNKNKLSNNAEIFLEKNLSNLSENSKVLEVNASTRQPLRFSNIYDLFQIPDFSTLKPAQTDKIDQHSTDGNLMDDDKCSVSTMDEENYKEELSIEEEEEWSGEDEECWVEEEDDQHSTDENLMDDDKCSVSTMDEENYEEAELSVQEEEEWSGEKEEDEEESDDFNADINNISRIYDEDQVITHSEEYNKSIHKSNSNGIPENVISKNDMNNVEINENHRVDYDILNNWYRQWHQQIDFIQTCVKMSK